jgi:hypothetical protein
MSEHIQQNPGPHAATAATTAEEHERTPGVAHEREQFDLRFILWIGVGLAATCLVVQLLVGWLLGGLEKFNAQPSGNVSTLALEDAKRPLAQRLDSVPAPRLEGIEREIEPRGIAAARASAETRMDRYGWTNRDDGIVHIPIEKALETVLQSNEFRTDANHKKGAGRTRLPTRSSSGRASAGGQR